MTFLRKVKETAGQIIVKFPKLSSIYYTFFSGKFTDEQYGVISGIYKNKIEKYNLGNFRRNIHRIEKALTTSPLKDEFAESYIVETVKIYKELKNDVSDYSTIDWAQGILNQYFNTVTETEIISKAKKEFQIIPQKGGKNLPKTYTASERKTAKVTFQDFFDLNIQRRSIRYYQDQIVPRELLVKAVNVALQAPSACNRQPFVFRVVDDPKLVKIAANLPMGAQTFAGNIKTLVFIIGDLSNFFDERDKHVIYIDASLAAMNFILALETLGLSSCIINWSDISENNLKLKKFLNLNNWERCVMSISVGYALPECGIPSSIKKDSKTIIRFNYDKDSD